MYQNILVAVALDQTQHLAETLKIARALSEDDAKITALNVIEEIPTFIANEMPPEVIANRKPSAEEELRSALGEATDVAAVVVFRHAGQSILGFAEENAIDCVVIASHKPGLQDFFLGSTAQRVVRHAQCAVHVLR